MLCWHLRPKGNPFAMFQNTVQQSRGLDYRLRRKIKQTGGWSNQSWLKDTVRSGETKSEHIHLISQSDFLFSSEWSNSDTFLLHISTHNNVEGLEKLKLQYTNWLQYINFRHESPNGQSLWLFDFTERRVMIIWVNHFLFHQPSESSHSPHNKLRLNKMIGGSAWDRCSQLQSRQDPIKLDKIVKILMCFISYLAHVFLVPSLQWFRV